MNTPFSRCALCSLTRSEKSNSCDKVKLDTFVRSAGGLTLTGRHPKSAPKSLRVRPAAAAAAPLSFRVDSIDTKLFVLRSVRRSLDLWPLCMFPSPPLIPPVRVRPCPHYNESHLPPAYYRGDEHSGRKCYDATVAVDTRQLCWVIELISNAESFGYTGGDPGTGP